MEFGGVCIILKTTISSVEEAIDSKLSLGINDSLCLIPHVMSALFAAHSNPP